MYQKLREETRFGATINEVKEYYEELQYNDYIMINDDHIIYNSNADLSGLARTLLDSMLEDEDYVDKLIDKDVLISYWIEGVTKKEAVEELIDSVDINELIGLNPITIYESYNKEILYSEIE